MKKISKLDKIVNLDLGIDLDIQIILRKSPRAQRIQVKISKGQAVLIVPTRVATASALEFLKLNKKWLIDRLSKQQRISFKPGSIISILGKEFTIKYNNSQTKGVSLNDKELLICGNCSELEIRIKRFLASMLKRKITEIANFMGNKLGVTFNKISIRDMSSRWGSCSSTGNLSFSLKLIFTREEIVDYVVAHELCHLKEMNHGKNFWDLVEEIYPHWQQAKKWLREEGKLISLLS
jgi:predicted metal-dependent hydrolase